MSSSQIKLFDIYNKLYKRFSSQNWWPADTDFEVVIGAILTQNTAWSNVEKAIASLKKKRLLSAKKLRALKLARLAELIRPSGYYNIKAKRIRAFLDCLKCLKFQFLFAILILRKMAKTLVYQQLRCALYGM